MANLAIPGSYGGFACVAQVVLDIPFREMMPQADLHSSHGVYYQEHFWRQVCGELPYKPAAKSNPEKGQIVLSVGSVFFWVWKDNKPSSVKYDELARRFPGKESPVPWWGFNLLMRSHYYGSVDVPFSLSTHQLVSFIPLRVKKEKEPPEVKLIRASGHVGTTSPEWWVDCIEKSDAPLDLKPTTFYLSWGKHIAP